MKVNIIILNYNGEGLIPQCMPSIIDAKNAAKNEARITVIDNQSTDKSVEILKRYGPEIEIIEHENRFFCSFNDVVADLDDDIVVLLNNDIKVDKNFVDPLVETFEDHPDAFLVGSKVLTFDKTGYEGTRSKWWIDKGVFKASSRFPGYEEYINKKGYIAQAGFGAFDRQKFLHLKGYDDLYLPGIMEDADLCYRAWKCGFKAYYQPESIIYHIGQASFKSRFGSYRIRKMSHRNTYLFMWKNLSDRGLLGQSLVYLIPRMLSALLRGKMEIPSGFLSALGRLPVALNKRREVQKTFISSDKEVLGVFKDLRN